MALEYPTDRQARKYITDELTRLGLSMSKLIRMTDYPGLRDYMYNENSSITLDRLASVIGALERVRNETD